MLCLAVSSVFGIPLRQYESKQLFEDPLFKNGFSVISQQTHGNSGIKLGEFTYSETATSPSWMIAQWNSGPCLWADRSEAGRYTITDSATKTVRYNPEDSSVSMRLNAANVYNGMPAGDSNWPHLLLEQSPLTDFASLKAEEKKFYLCSADRMVLSLDIRLSDFVDTTNKEGVNAAQYLAYFYLCGTEGDKFIWFGVNLFDSRGYSDSYWALDNGSGNMIYSLSTKDTFGSNRRSLYRNAAPYVSDEWTRIKLDLKPFIEDAMRKANESGTFAETVSVEDFYIGGTNIGFEIHGNYDCTVDIRNFTLTSYSKK